MPYQKGVISVTYSPLGNLLCGSVSSCVSRLGSFDRRLPLTLIRGARRFSPFITRRQSGASNYRVKEGKPTYYRGVKQPETNIVSDSYDTQSKLRLSGTKYIRSHTYILFHYRSLPRSRFWTSGARPARLFCQTTYLTPRTYLLSHVVSGISIKVRKLPHTPVEPDRRFCPLTQEVNNSVSAVILLEDCRSKTGSKPLCCKSKSHRHDICYIWYKPSILFHFGVIRYMSAF